MVERNSQNTTDEQTCCKAGRVGTKYEFVNFLNGRLADKWSDADGPGLRTLTEEFNKKLLERALVDSGDPPLEGEVGVIYEQLTDDTEGTGTRVERRLEKKDIDPNELRDDFISYKTIDRHFKHCVDREREQPDPVTEDDAINRIRALQRRVEKVATKTLKEVDNHSSTGFDEFDVSASVTVVCSDCGERKSFTRAVREGCDCIPLDSDQPRDDASEPQSQHENIAVDPE